jgi:hypothetical protein
LLSKTKEISDIFKVSLEIPLKAIGDENYGDVINPQRIQLEEIRELEEYLEEELEKKETPVKAMIFRGLVSKIICRQKEAPDPSIIKIFEELRMRQTVLDKRKEKRQRNVNPEDTWEERQNCRIVNILAEFNSQVYDKSKESRILNHIDYSNDVKYQHW